MAKKKIARCVYCGEEATGTHIETEDWVCDEHADYDPSDDMIDALESINHHIGREYISMSGSYSAEDDEKKFSQPKKKEKFIEVEDDWLNKT